MHGQRDRIRHRRWLPVSPGGNGHARAQTKIACRVSSMYPSPDAVPGALQAVVAALATGNAATARTHMDAIAFHRQDAALRTPPPPQALAEIYDRDRYQCRYCGRKTVLIEVMRLLSELFPEQFPYHRNWKTSETHQAYWSVSATHDHVVPLSRGGDPPISATSSRRVGRAMPANPGSDSKILALLYASRTIRPGEGWPTFIRRFGNTAGVRH
jgi:hypothetical protein